MPAILKSVLAVLAGLATAIIMVMLLTLAAVFVFFGGDMTADPTPPYLAVNIAYSFGAAVLGGWVTARLAPAREFTHAVAAAVVIFLLSFAGTGAEAEANSAVPGWYGTALAALGPTGMVLGGWLGARTTREDG